MIARFIHKKNNSKMIKHFATSNKPKDPNNDYKTVMILAIAYSFFETGRIIYKIYKDK